MLVFKARKFRPFTILTFSSKHLVLIHNLLKNACYKTCMQSLNMRKVPYIWCYIVINNFEKVNLNWDLNSENPAFHADALPTGLSNHSWDKLFRYY